MSIVAHPIFIDRRVASEAYIIREFYVYVEIYIRLAKESLRESPDSTAASTLENLVRIVDFSRNERLSFNQRISCFNVINHGVALLNDLIQPD